MFVNEVDVCSAETIVGAFAESFRLLFMSSEKQAVSSKAHAIINNVLMLISLKKKKLLSAKYVGGF